MAFRIFYNSTTADSQDMNDNFYHIAQGSIMPRTGQSLTSTDSAYDIGSSSYKWDSAYIDTINCSTVSFTGSITCDKIWTFLYEYTMPSGTSSARVEITGVDYEYYKFIVECGQVFLRPNGDSSLSYRYSEYQALTTNTYTTSWGTNTAIVIGDASATTHMYFKSNPGFKSGGSYDVLDKNEQLLAGTYLWTSTDTITSLVFSCFGNSVSFKIYKKG